jgi:hypothetical protein
METDTAPSTDTRGQGLDAAVPGPAVAARWIRTPALLVTRLGRSGHEQERTVL